MNEIANYFRLNIVKMKEVKIRGWYRAKKHALWYYPFLYSYIQKFVIGLKNRPFVHKIYK